MRCGEARNWLSLAHDGCLPPDRTLSVERHLEGCADCRTYREDLRLASRLLRATEPTLPESFDWRLGVRLNNRLAEAAREATAPWERARTGPWWGRLGLGAAAGVLAATVLGIWVLPGGQTVQMSPGSAMVAEATRAGASPTAMLDGGATGEAMLAEVRTDRLPLAQQFSGPVGASAVSYGSRGAFGREPGAGIRSWSGENPGDLRAIVSLREDNQRLRAALMLAQREIDALKAQRQRAEAAGIGAVVDSVRTPGLVRPMPADAATGLR